MARGAGLLGPLALAVGALLGAGWPGAVAAAPAADPGGSAGLGQALYQHDCATCHGPTGAGSYQAPAIDHSGQASVDFMIGTGRMPPPAAALQIEQQPRRYDSAEQAAILTYTAGFVQGPAIPQPDPGADLAHGGELYRANCAACHQAIGSGGALAYGAEAPPLDRVDPTRTVEAIRIGPGRMPVFGPDVLNDSDADAIAAYVSYLQAPQDRGGWALGHLGPVSEGLLAVLAGLGSLVVVTRWLGTRVSEEAEEVIEATEAAGAGPGPDSPLTPSPGGAA
jgi:ubiquinol-cytochrome c reductase cytochrome c subunit